MKSHPALGRLGRGLCRWGGRALALFLVLVLATAVVPYWLPPRLSPQEQAAFDPAACYGDAPCTDRVALVETPAQALDTRMQLLAEARHTLDIAYYGMPMGETTDLFLAGVLAAAQRGVQVRLLVDGVSGGLTHTHPNYARALGAHPNIQLCLYNSPCPFAPWTYNGRLHDKYIICDGRLLLLGGRNIGDRYFGGGDFEGPLSLDRDVLVYDTAWQAGPDTPGGAISQVRRYLDSIWSGPAVRQPFEESTRGSREVQQTLLALADTLPAAAPADWPSLTLPAARVTLLHGGTGIGPKAPVVAHALGQLLSGAEHSVLLQSPYIVPDAPLMELLEQLGRQGLDFTLLTNSLAVSPNLPAGARYQANRQKILAAGPRLMEYQGPDCLHAKTYLIDQRLALVGSFNLDPRSAYIDTELLLAIDSVPFARQLQTVLDGYLSHALPIGPEGQALPGAVPPQPAGAFKTLVSRVAGVLLAPFQALV